MEYSNMVVQLAKEFPWLVGLFAAMGALRVINKPLFGALKMYARSTKTKRDDRLLRRLERSQVYQILSLVLDFSASIKLPSSAPRKSSDGNPED